MAESSDWRFSVYRLIGTVGIFLIMAFFILTGGGAFTFVHARSAIGIVGLTLFLLVGTFESDFLKFVPASLKTLCFTPQEPNPRFAEIACFGSRYALGATVVYTLIELISMLQNLSDPDQIGWSVAVGLLPVLYGVVLAEMFFAMVYKAFSGPGNTDSKPLSGKGIAIVMAVIGLTIVRLSISLWSFSEMA